MWNISEIELLKKFAETKKRKKSYDYETLAEFIEDNTIKAVRKRRDYELKKRKIKQIMDKYPKIRAFIEDENTEELTIEELKKLREIAILQVEIQNIKNEEIFKLGINSSILW